MSASLGRKKNKPKKQNNKIKDYWLFNNNNNKKPVIKQIDPRTDANTTGGTYVLYAVHTQILSPHIQETSEGSQSEYWRQGESILTIL